MDRTGRLQLNADWVLPIATPPIRRGCVVVEGSRIVFVGAQDSAPQLGAEVREYGPAILMPGLVNAHCHLNYSLLRGRLDFSDAFWTLKQISLIKHQVLTEEDTRAAVAFGALESIRFGITTVATVVDRHYLYTPRLSAALGLRTMGLLSIKRKTPQLETLDALLAEIAGPQQDGLLSVGLMPHTVYSLAPERLREVSRYAARRDLRVFIHLAELREELDFFKRVPRAYTEVGEGLRLFYENNDAVSSPVDAAYQADLLTSRTGAVHCAQLDDRDIELLRQAGSSVVLCPHTNLRMGNGLAPVHNLLAGGVEVCLGTDSAATSSRYDLFDEMHLLAFASRMAQPHLPELASEWIVRAATLSGAAALGLDDQIGSLEPGKSADLIAVALDPLACMGIDNPYDLLVYVCRCTDVCLTMIDGRVLYQRGHLLIDEAEAILQQARAATGHIGERLLHAPVLPISKESTE
ncbi:MAG TPA: amidohydrolase family protein [Herpetosiphonaceae bacterium]